MYHYYAICFQGSNELLFGNGRGRPTLHPILSVPDHYPRGGFASTMIMSIVIAIVFVENYGFIKFLY